MEAPDRYDLGLQADLEMMKQSPLNRRRFLKMGAATLALFLAGCRTTAEDETAQAADSPGETTGDTAVNAPAAGEVCVEEIPSETAGPFPANGSQASLNALAMAGIVRSDIRTSLGTGNTAEGIPCRIELTLVNTNDDCAPLAGHAIYAWHCDREGSYSMYSAPAVNEDYLRGVQPTDSEGKATFMSIFPACYPGRWPHVHFEIYPSLDEATSARNVLHTSQLAYPEDVCNAAYATAGYEQSVRSLSQVSLESDGVFRDGVELQMATVSGDAAGGYTARLTVGVAA